MFHILVVDDDKHIGRLHKRFEGWAEFSVKSVRGLGYKTVKNV